MHTRIPFFFTSLSLTDQYLVKDSPPPQRLRLHSRSGCGVCSVACQDFIIIPLKNNFAGRSGASQRSCRSVRSSRTHCFGSALRWGAREEGREGVTLLTESHKTDLRQIDHGDEGRGQEDDT